MDNDNNINYEPGPVLDLINSLNPHHHPRIILIFQMKRLRCRANQRQN